MRDKSILKPIRNHRVLVDFLTLTKNSQSKTSIFEEHMGRVFTPQNIKMICRRYPLHKNFFKVFLLSKLGPKMLITQRRIVILS